ncbi:hypothetical protein RU88_GL002050 [Lactococcus raffinolactis]|nr:hypothetical protein RU88_GL002050 [Lactococcus raffinolactis]
MFFTPFTALETVFLIPSQMPDMKSLIPLNTLLVVSLMPCQIPLTKSAID